MDMERPLLNLGVTSGLRKGGVSIYVEIESKKVGTEERDRDKMITPCI